MKYITIFDYLLLPVYLYIFYIIIKKISVKYTDPELRKYFFTSFYLHMFGAVAYALMVQYYYGYGDSFVFYYGSNFLSSHVAQDAGNIKYFFQSATDVKAWYDFEVGDLSYSGYFGIDSNLFIMKIAAVISLVSFNMYLIITLFFGLFSFAGLWKLFLVFKDVNKNKQVKLLVWAVLYMPSVWFWGSGLIKDSVCIGGIGFIIHYMYSIFIKKEISIKSIILLVVLIYVVGSIKSYITIVLTLGLAMFVFYKFITPFKNIVIRGFIITVFLIAIVIAAFITNFGEQLQQLADESKVQVDAFQRNYDAVQNDDEQSRAGVKIEDIDPSVSGLLLHSPVAVFTCLFRPFIWESRKIFILFSALESMLLLCCTMYVLVKLKFFGFFREMFDNPYILISFLMAILFALIIGFTTYNFGTIARYRIVLLPFYFFTLVSLYTVYKEKEKKPA
jgi:hypothetical protein